MATKNLLNIDWDTCEDDFYDEFIEEETNRKLKMKSKDRDFSGPKMSKKNSLSSKIVTNKNDYEEDFSVPNNQYVPYLKQDLPKKKESSSPNVDKKDQNQINNEQSRDYQKKVEK